MWSRRRVDLVVQLVVVSGCHGGVERGEEGELRRAAQISLRAQECEYE